jgi:two-component system sensor histidine kinase ChvG
MRALSRIFPRLLLFNVLLVFLPAAGLLYLDTYEEQLLRSQERAMVQQGRVLAAALGGGGDLEAEEATGVLARLERRVDARLRIVDAQGALLADSSRLGPRSEDGDDATGAYRHNARERWIYKLGALGTLAVQRLLHGPAPDLESGEIYDGQSRLRGEEIRAALSASVPKPTIQPTNKPR